MGTDAAAQAIFRKRNTEYMRVNGKYQTLSDHVSKTKQSAETCQKEADEAAEQYADAKRNVHQIELDLQELSKLASDLINWLNRHPSSEDDSQQEQQKRQEAKMRLEQLRAKIQKLQKDKDAQEAIAEKAFQDARNAQSLAEKYRGLLAEICRNCEVIASELDESVAELERDVIPCYGQAQRGFSDVGSTKYKGNSREAERQAREKQATVKALSDRVARLGAQYRHLASQSIEAPDGGDGGESGNNPASTSMGGKSRGLGSRTRDLAVGVMVTASMATGAVYHATRPPQTFNSELTPLQVIEKRWDEAQNSLTPDDFVSDIQSRDERDEWLAPQKRLRRR